MTSVFISLDRLVQKILRWLTVTLFIVLAVLLLSNVFLRLTNDLSFRLTEMGFEGASAMIKKIVPIASMHWFDEIVEMCFAAMIFYGAASLWGTKGHFSVGDWISPRLPNPRARAFYRMMISLLSVVFLAVFFWYSLRLTTHATELTTVFQIPKSLLYSCMPISSFIMLVYSLCDVYARITITTVEANGV